MFKVPIESIQNSEMPIRTLYTFPIYQKKPLGFYRIYQSSIESYRILLELWEILMDIPNSNIILYDPFGIRYNPMGSYWNFGKSYWNSYRISYWNSYRISYKILEQILLDFSYRIL